MRHPSHLAAKRAQARWPAGYQSLIVQVLACYGDGGIEHPR